MGGLSLRLKPVALRGVCGWDGVVGAAAREWLHHVATTQAHAFLAGLAPVHAVVRAGARVRDAVTQVSQVCEASHPPCVM